MSCDPHRSLLSVYLDGDLDPAPRTAVASHLAACSACRGELAGLERLAGHLATARDAAPAHDLWPAIAAGIGRRRRLRAVAPLAAAAAGVALLIGLWSRGLPSAPTGQAAPALPVQAEGWERDDAQMLQAAWRGLLQEPALPAAARPLLDDQLAALDAAVGEILAALRQSPEDPFLRAHLIRTLRTQARLLHHARGLLPEAMSADGRAS
jgi:anti-sigma factor RsiW